MNFTAKDGAVYKISLMDQNSKYKKETINLINSTWIKSDERLLKNLFENKYSTDFIPANFIVEFEGELVGFCSLLRTDLPYRSDIFPWFGNCFIKEKFRRLGIMQVMQNYACNYAKEAGFKKLYLWTKDKSLYENLGWNYLEDIELNLEQKVYLYVKNCKLIKL